MLSVADRIYVDAVRTATRRDGSGEEGIGEPKGSESWTGMRGGGRGRLWAPGAGMPSEEEEQRSSRSEMLSFWGLLPRPRKPFSSADPLLHSPLPLPLPFLALLHPHSAPPVSSSASGGGEDLLRTSISPDRAWRTRARAREGENVVGWDGVGGSAGMPRNGSLYKMIQTVLGSRRPSLDLSRLRRRPLLFSPPSLERLPQFSRGPYSLLPPSPHNGGQLVSPLHQREGLCLHF